MAREVTSKDTEELGLFLKLKVETKFQKSDSTLSRKCALKSQVHNEINPRRKEVENTAK